MKKAAILIICLITAFAYSRNSLYAQSPLTENDSTYTVDDQTKKSDGAADNTTEKVSISESLTLLFAGDIMGHDRQIRSALQPDKLTYDYTPCFDYIREYISAADLAIGNLEVTLAGPPYKGYPRFSSPDALAEACKDAGFDVLVTANNHSVDRGKKGLERTIKILDTLNIPHTGTFLSYTDKQKKTPLIIEKNNFKIALINYTYGTNDIPVPKPSVVNLNRIDRLEADIAKAKLTKPDSIILFIHWGTEYRNEPDAGQLELADICFNAGADIIIGSHPHVIQKSIWINQPGSRQFVAYSLGNFISNQNTTKTNGGQMIQLTLLKENGITTISDANYMLTWVYGPGINLKKKFYILPCKDFENRPEFFTKPEYYNKMKNFIDESRKLLDVENLNVNEIK